MEAFSPRPPSRLSPPSFPLSQTFTHTPFMSERKLQVIATSKLKALKDTHACTHTRTHSSLKHSRAATVCEVCLSVSRVIDYQLISRSDRTRSLILSDFQERLFMLASFDPSDPLFSMQMLIRSESVLAVRRCSGNHNLCTRGNVRGRDLIQFCMAT